MRGPPPRLYFADETGINLPPYLPYGWQKKGHPLQIMCRTKSKRLNLFGLMRLNNHLSIVADAIAKVGSYEAFLVAVVLAGAIQFVLGLIKAGRFSSFFPIV